MNPSESSPVQAPGGPQEIRFLNIIAAVAILDFLLLIPLVWASRWVADEHGVVSILGPIHGFFFVVLIGLCAYGALQRWWGWWFPLITVITGGPIGSLIGDWIVRRKLREGGAR
jgi:CHASE2 domain-containing sensor protein